MKTLVDSSMFLPVYACVHHMQAWCPQKSEGVRSPGIGIIDVCELPCECWELNMGPPQKEQVLLTTKVSL